MKSSISDYKKQTKYTNPGKYEYLYSVLPNDVISLVKIVNGLLIHPSKISKYPVLK